MSSETNEPPYQRIVSEMRDRVARGDLKIGARLPSTRRLAAKWGVAIATATKALKELSSQGIVKATPRVGMIISGAPPRPGQKAARDHELSRARVVEAAIEMADREGLQALSIRGVAAKLKVPVMSLYRHVPSKQELLHLMSTAVLAEEALPDAPLKSWRAQIEYGARAQWRAYRRHPWMARVVTITRPQPDPSSMRHAEWALGGLAAAGLDAEAMMNAHIVVYAFIQGLATNIEAEADAREESGLDETEWMAREEPTFAALASSGNYPVFARVLGELEAGYDLDLDVVFELGLRAMLDGLAAMIEKKTPAKKAAPKNPRLRPR